MRLPLTIKPWRCLNLPARSQDRARIAFTVQLSQSSPDVIEIPAHVYEVRPRKDHTGVDLISDMLPFSRLSYGEQNAIANAIGYAEHRSRSHDAIIRVY